MPHSMPTWRRIRARRHPLPRPRPTPARRRRTPPRRAGSRRNTGAPSPSIEAPRARGTLLLRAVRPRRGGGRTRGPLAADHPLDPDLDHDVVAEHHPALVEAPVPEHVELLPVDGRLRLPAGALPHLAHGART